MIRPTALARLLARDAFLALAVLAIVLKVLVPAGFMPNAEARNGLPFALVLCTADGAKMVAPGDLLASHQDDQDDHGEKKPAHDGPCPFAAQGPAAPPVEIALAGEALTIAHSETPPPLARTVVPGRGLAAPPPPATGPPSFLI